jgi:hypothetical protein
LIVERTVSPAWRKGKLFNPPQFVQAMAVFEK